MRSIIQICHNGFALGVSGCLFDEYETLEGDGNLLYWVAIPQRVNISLPILPDHVAGLEVYLHLPSYTQQSLLAWCCVVQLDG